MSQQSGTRYNLNIDGVVKSIASKGAKMITPFSYDSEKLKGLEWNLSKFQLNENTVHVPEKAVIYETTLGEVSIRFTNFNSQRMVDPESQFSDDEETQQSKVLFSWSWEEESDEEEKIITEFLQTLSINKDNQHKTLEGWEDWDDNFEWNNYGKSPEINTSNISISPNSIENLLSQDFKQEHLQEQVDDLIINLIGYNFSEEEVIKILNSNFYLEKISEIEKGLKPITDFRKTTLTLLMADNLLGPSTSDPRGKIPRMDGDLNMGDVEDTQAPEYGKTAWNSNPSQYQGESSIKGTGN